jgi:hypothetical protein
VQGGQPARIPGQVFGGEQFFVQGPQPVVGELPSLFDGDVTGVAEQLGRDRLAPAAVDIGVLSSVSLALSTAGREPETGVLITMLDSTTRTGGRKPLGADRKGRTASSPPVGERP